VLEGRVVVVAGGTTDLGRVLAEGLTDHGATVRVVPNHYATRQSTAEALPGPFDALVHMPDDGAARVRVPLDQVDDAAWDARGEAVLRSALWCCQAAYVALRERGGRIVLVTPTVAILGTDGLTPYATAVEGIRTLAKAAARQWGSAGITVNCVAPSLSVLGLGDDPVGSPLPAITRRPDVRGDVAGVVATLLGPATSAVTGATIVVDGGAVMAP
jgi:3-oxoacyl-[acyl-carrier protein] reductase